MGSSRNENILESIINGTPYNLKPLSREEALLLLLKEKIGIGGSSPEEIKQNIFEYLDQHADELTNLIVVNDETAVTEATKILLKDIGVTMESPDMDEFNTLVRKTVGNSTLTLEEIDQIFKEV